MTQIESLESSVFYKRFLKERRRIISSTSLLTEGSSVKTDDNDGHKKWVVCVPQSRSLKARNITRRDVGTLNGEASFIVTPDKIYKNDNWENVTQCDTSNRPTINIQDTQPNYLLYHSNENNNFYPPESTKNLFINDDAHYMVAFYNNTNETFKWAKIIFNLPSYAQSMYSIVNKDYEVRYFSISTIDLSQPRQTVETIHDVILQEHSMNGYIALIVSCNEDGKFLLHLEPPSKNDNHSCITKTSYFGVLYRQLMPRFKNEIPKHIMSNQTLKNIMNKYYPEIYWF